MGKRKVAFIVCVLGITMIVISSMGTSYAKQIEDDKETFVKENLKSLAKKCIDEGECEKNTVLLRTLKEKGYVERDIYEKVSIYDNDSYVTFPDYTVVLIK